MHKRELISKSTIETMSAGRRNQDDSGRRHREAPNPPLSSLRLPPIMNLAPPRYLPDPTTPTPGPRISDLINRAPIPSPSILSPASITTSSSSPIDKAIKNQPEPPQGSYKPAHIWRRSDRRLFQLRHLHKDLSLLIFSPTIAPPPDGQSTIDNPFEVLGRAIQRIIPHVEHADYPVSTDEPFQVAHAEFCRVASAVIMVMCETGKAGVGTWKRQERFAMTLVKILEKRCAVEQLEIPIVLVRIGKGSSRSVSGFEVEIVAERYTEAELEVIADVLFRG